MRNVELRGYFLLHIDGLYSAFAIFDKGVLRPSRSCSRRLSLTGCTGHGNMYNLSTGEKTTFSYSSNGRGRGEITGTFASGEVATGEYSVISGGSVGWGSVYTSVYTPKGVVTGNGSAVAVTQNGAGGVCDTHRHKGDHHHLRIFSRLVWPWLRGLQEQQRCVVQVAFLSRSEWIFLGESGGGAWIFAP